MSGEGVGLGRGLGALLGGESVAAVERRRVRFVPLERIAPNPRQPRTEMDAEALDGLAESIRANGVLQPLLVRTAPGGDPERFELVAGERRLRAAGLAGLDAVPVLIQEMDDGRSLELALLENVQREDLNPVDAARGYQRLVQEFAYSHERIAGQVGKSRMAVSNALRLLKLPPPVLEMTAAGRISSGHARALLGLAEEADGVIALAQELIENDWSVRETERQVRQRLELAAAATGGESEGEDNDTEKQNVGRRDPSILALEKKLAFELRSRVHITHAKGRGKLILEYDSPKALAELSQRLLGRARAGGE